MIISLLRDLKEGNTMIDYAPGMRTIIRDEEWMIKEVNCKKMSWK